MGSLTFWLSEHWYSLLESIGIIVGLIFTGVTVQRDLEARRVAEYLTLATQHRRLWGQLHRRKVLRHLLDADRDIRFHPVTHEETHFLRQIFVHYHTSWLISREGGLLLPRSVLAADAGNFFHLPVPHHAWEQIKGGFQAEFVSFIADAVRAHAAKTARHSSSI